MMTELPLIRVAAAPTFNRNLRRLAKKYRSIKRDVQSVIQQLEQGELLGDQISGIGYPVFKLRIRNSDIQKGKSGSYRQYPNQPQNNCGREYFSYQSFCSKELQDVEFGVHQREHGMLHQ